MKSDQAKMTLVVCRVILATLAVLFILGAGSKVVSPYDARSALGAVVAETTSSSFFLRPHLNLVIASVAAVEMFLGLMLLFYVRPRLIASISVLVLGVFTFFLWILLQLPEVPSCGCVGGWSGTVEDGRSQAQFGIVRNLAFAALAAWTVVQSRSNSERVPTVPVGTAGAGPRGFTLLELLVSVVIISVVLSIALPGIAGARKSAKESRHLSNLRQLFTSLTTYATDSSDRFPAVLRGSGEDVDSLGRPLPGTSLPPQSYLVRSSLFWTDPLVTTGHDLPVEPGYGEPDELNPIRRTHYPLTGAAFAEPELFVDDPVTASTLLRVQLVSRTRHPASKGYLLVTHSDGWMPDRDDLDPVLAGRGDGSASKRSPRVEALADPYGNAIGWTWPVLWTRHGLEGQDF